jgi:hypothetical protein
VVILRLGVIFSVYLPLIVTPLERMHNVLIYGEFFPETMKFWSSCFKEPIEESEESKFYLLSQGCGAWNTPSVMVL